MYTTNVIEGLNSQYRKVTKTKLILPTAQSLQQMLYWYYVKKIDNTNGEFLINQLSSVCSILFYRPNQVEQEIGRLETLLEMQNIEDRTSLYS